MRRRPPSARSRRWKGRICNQFKKGSYSLIFGSFFPPTRQFWIGKTDSNNHKWRGENEAAAIGWKQAGAPELPFPPNPERKGPAPAAPISTTTTTRNAFRAVSLPGWRGGRGGARGRGSRARRSCSRGSTCCTRSCARPRGSCIGRRSSWTAAASATAATAGSPRRRRTRRRPAVARHEHAFNPTSPLKPIKNQETEQLNNHHQVNYLPWRLCSSAREGSRDRWPSRRRRTEAAECGAEGRGRTGGAAFAGKHSAGAASGEPL